MVYDSLGNIIQQPTRTGSRALTYFADGNVRTVTDGATSAQFRYDAFGEVQELDVASATSPDTRHDRRYGALIAWRDEGGASVLSRQIPGPGGLSATRHGAGGSWVFAFGEARGSRFFTDETGAFVQDVKYQPFGEPTSTGAKPGSHQYSNMQWNGGDALAALGVSQLGARLYDPVIGRFLSRDPLLAPRTAATTNPYAFANNDPVNNSDPSGLETAPNDGSASGRDLDTLNPKDVARLHLLPGIYVARGVGVGLDAVGNAIGNAASAVSHFFGLGGGHAARVSIDPAHARSLMRVTSIPVPQFGSDAGKDAINEAAFAGLNAGTLRDEREDEMSVLGQILDQIARALIHRNLVVRFFDTLDADREGNGSRYDDDHPGEHQPSEYPEPELPDIPDRGPPSLDPGSSRNLSAAEHNKNKLESNREKHEDGQTRKKRDQGGEKGDTSRRPPRVRPPGHRGPWPPNPN